MRLWHEALLPRLDNKRLLAQHRECAALRGNGWGRKHSVVDYAFTHPRWWLVMYHFKVMKEMQNRGMKPDQAWLSHTYRGKHCPSDEYFEVDRMEVLMKSIRAVYPEHDDAYMQECINNLSRKGAKLNGD